MFGFAMVWHIWWLVIFSFILLIILIIKESANDDDEYVISANEVEEIELKSRDDSSIFS